MAFNDPQGDLVFTIIGALLAPVTGGASLAIGIAAYIGGLGNVAYNYSKGNINSWGDGLAAYGIGTVAAGGAYALAPVAVGAMGLSLSGGFVTGAVYGGVGAGIEEIARNAGNAAVFQDVTWGEAFGNIGLGIVAGAAVGGAIEGFKASKNGNNFWNGKK